MNQQDYTKNQNRMTEQEMNDFLQSIGGLENGMHSNREPITNAGFFECDSGWYQLIKDLITDLIELGWNKEVCQIKEKFGGLRFYINEASDEMHDRISQAEKESYETCEDTGQPGKLRTDLGWWVTLCDAEYEKRLAEKIRKQIEQKQ
jgi:hypothetical protein